MDVLAPAGYIYLRISGSNIKPAAQSDKSVD